MAPDDESLHLQLSVVDTHCSGHPEACPEYPSHVTSSHQANSHFNLVWTEIFLLAIAFSFLFRGHQLWQRNPFTKNCCVIVTLILVAVLQVLAFLSYI